MTGIIKNKKEDKLTYEDLIRLFHNRRFEDNWQSQHGKIDGDFKKCREMILDAWKDNR